MPLILEARRSLSASPDCTQTGAPRHQTAPGVILSVHLRRADLRSARTPAEGPRRSPSLTCTSNHLVLGMETTQTRSNSPS
jgi:hypothetical protein